MGSRYFTFIFALILSLMLFYPAKTFSQIIRATGTSSEASSQLIYWYDNIYLEGIYDVGTQIQVTNTNDTEGVWIHVQIFRNYDPDLDTVGGGEADGGADLDNGPHPPVICDERDFIDFLTPNDTHVYNLYEFPFNKNEGESETQVGEQVSIDLDTGPSGTKGFVVITPVVSESDLSAISFQYLTGNGRLSDPLYAKYNAMGRDAVDFTNGEVLPAGTPLDGETGGYVVLQPEELLINFGDPEPGFTDVDVVGIVFEDSYGPAGLLGYQVIPATATWTSFIFDFKEDPTSCGTRTIDCFDDMGLNEQFVPQFVMGDADGDGGAVFSQFNPALGLDALCPGVNITPFPSGVGDGDGDGDGSIGWTRIFVSDLGDFVNHVGIFAQLAPADDAKWMFTR